MKDDVKHKWLMLDKDVNGCELLDDLLTQGREDSNVEFDQIMYGYKEALTKVFIDNGYHQMSKNRCVMVKTEGDKVSYCSITVDDCFFAITKDEDWIGEAIDMLKRAFDELTVDRGETINILGMTVHMDRERKRTVINQKHILDNLFSTYGITKTAITPATGDLMYVQENINLLDDQRKFMSLNATLMYESKRTYPEISFAVVSHRAAIRLRRTTIYSKAMRVAEYVAGCGDKHGLILSLKSLQIVAKSDASQAEHVDGKSHTGGCVGFESDNACWFMWLTIKQRVVAH